MLYTRLKSILNTHKHIAVVILLAIAFFFMASSFNFFVQEPDYTKFNSPDENANYVFSKIYAQTNDLKIKEKYNLYTSGIIKPRSVLSDGAWLKPISFLGIILIFGTIAKFIGVSTLPFLTPAFASLGLIFFYLLIKRIFGKKISLISTILLFAFPVYIYYSARSLLHNVLFVSLFIIALYFISLAFEQRERIKSKFLSLKFSKYIGKNFLFSALAGIFLGLTIMTRTSELLWMLPVFLFLTIFYVKRLTVFRVLVFLSFLGIALLPMFYWNQVLYGAPFNFGYSQLNNSLGQINQGGKSFISNVSQGEINLSALEQIKDQIFYFGFQAKKSINSFYYYFIDMFSWIFGLTVIGVLLAVSKIKFWKKRHWVFFVSWFLLSTFLIFYYGSWEFTDNPDPASNTIGNSYTRYWLPVYLGALPLVSLAIIKISRALVSIKINTRLKRLLVSGVQIVLIGFLMIKSFYFVTMSPEEGLYHTALKYKYNQTLVEKVWQFTPYNAIIITRYHDKYLFPERKVIKGLLTDNNMNEYYAQAAKHFPIYYFNFTFSPRDMEYLNNKKLKEAGLNIKKVKDLAPNFSLYKLYLINDKL